MFSLVTAQVTTLGERTAGLENAFKAAQIVFEIIEHLLSPEIKSADPKKVR